MIAALLLSGLTVCKAARATVFEDEIGDRGGVIKVGDGSKCLDVYGDNIHADKVTIYAATCNGDAGQVWKHEGGRLKNVASGRCLDIKGASVKNGANLILFKCNGQKNQQFQFNKATNSIYQPTSSKCLDVEHRGQYRVVLWTCKSSQNQKMGWAAEWSMLQTSDQGAWSQSYCCTPPKSACCKPPTTTTTTTTTTWSTSPVNCGSLITNDEAGRRLMGYTQTCGVNAKTDGRRVNGRFKLFVSGRNKLCNCNLDTESIKDSAERMKGCRIGAGPLKDMKVLDLAYLECKGFRWRLMK